MKEMIGTAHIRVALKNINKLSHIHHKTMHTHTHTYIPF